jgi:hypothetical protein
MKGRLLVSLVVLAMAASSCAEPDLMIDSVAPETDSATSDRAPQATSTLLTSTTAQKTAPTNPPSDGGAVVPPAADNILVEKARADLAKRLGISADLIDVVSLRQVEWPDGGFGCPEPGTLYPQIISMGWEIILVSDGVNYSYHSGGAGDPFYCEKPSNSLEGS